MPSISKRILGAIALAVTVPLSLSACGGGDSGGSAASGDKEKIAIGIKFDQPGLGLKNPDGTYSGFDVDVATFVAEQLGYTPDKIEWKEAVSAQRENLIDNNQVDYIVATYSITDERKKRVDFAGPYLVTGQSLLVHAGAAAPAPSPLPGAPADTARGARPGAAPALAAGAARARAGFVVQFAAVRTAAAAEAQAAAIRVEGRQARVISTETDGVPIYRVVLGPFATREEAERIGRGAARDYWIFEGLP
jgi:ABC-type amino acid transport substrate-binding protein